MTLTRLLPLQAHAVLEALIAPAIIIVPLLLGLPAVAIVGAGIVGGLMMGSAIQVSGRSPRVSAHLGSDVLVTVLAAGVAIGMAATGEFVAACFFAIAAFLQVLLAVSTRYSGSGVAT